MAKAKGKGGSTGGIKISFCKRKKGKLKKSYGQKAEKPKKDRGQGR